MRGERPYHMLVSSRRLGDFRQPEPDIGPSVGQIVLMNSGMCRLPATGKEAPKTNSKVVFNKSYWNNWLRNR